MPPAWGGPRVAGAGETAAAAGLGPAGDDAGAFCAHAQVHLPGMAGGALDDLSFAAKDVFAIEGVASCFGNPTWLATHAPAVQTARAIDQLVAAGATMSGLTVTDELALSLTGENHHYGTPANPRAPGRVAGGSSSGSAAAVAAGLVDFALGTDTGGSVRVPASHCGLYGFRPTHGAVSTDGVLPLAPRFDTVGWLARDPDVLARVGDVLLPAASDGGAGAGATAVGLPSRLLVPQDVSEILGRSTFTSFVRGAVGLVARLGRPLRAVTVGDGATPIGGWLKTYLALQNFQVTALHRSWIERARPVFGPLIAGRLERALATSGAEAARAEWRREYLCARLAALLDGEEGTSWILWPSAAGIAPPRGLADDVIDAETGRSLTLGALASLAGLPQVSLPLVEIDDFPFGVSLIGPRGADRALLTAIKHEAPAHGGQGPGRREITEEGPI